ncbi:hypothetical protein [Candidatus Chrysopegis kryptomonas]|uniref:Uncharacterized protein n=1 Tax=Candidatus Chryseopegocella kryptomonas TaxID=1633643 RepID=A0A0P1MLR4_9BACT|nr:hypothetical protein [Candidatus Chrysopegis kryptomonas]CUS96389.1 hypothetical protein JGI23_00114 [Candidatus Chrysopegis kryptomonas]
MKLLDVFGKIKKIHIRKNCVPVVRTVATELKKFVLEKSSRIVEIEEVESFDVKFGDGVMYISAGDEFIYDGYEKAISQFDGAFSYFKINDDGSGILTSSKPYYLFSFFAYLTEDAVNDDFEQWREGKFVPVSFKWIRSVNDFFLTQQGRIQRNFDREAYIRGLAKFGFTHIEVNGLGFPMGIETGPKGEVYPMFYTYLPALDQFVYSELNRGIYPFYYLSINLAFLKKNARLAIKYGLSPGLLCFEPRSVPEEFFARYPMLRGARVDHPFRSFKPRFNMTIAHPKVLEHYAEMLRKLMIEVPELEYLVIWTNDSGAGFEHTKSLYVGRNGGAYLIREWKSDEEIAKVAGQNVLRFFKTLRDSAMEINPDFKVITRMEPFYGEHEIVWSGLEKGIEVETNTLLGRGWSVPYSHPKYPELKEVGGTPYQIKLDEKEKDFISELKSKGSNAHFYFVCGPFTFFDPLLGVPYPWLTYEKLKSMKEKGVEFTANMGGINPPNLVPFNINQEIIRIFQFNPNLNIDDEIERIAKSWAGDKAGVLIKVWKLAEESILSYPIPVHLYSTFGFTWLRIWVRPLVPNIEAIPEKERRYYEEFMCSTPHNPNNVDLMKDVLFELTDRKRCEVAVERMDKFLFPPLESAIKILSDELENLRDDSPARKVLFDQFVRLKALKCWFKTMRNVSAWIAGVHGYLESQSDEEKRRYKVMIREMIEDEIENANELVKLWENSNGVEFMAVTDMGETPLIHGENFPELLKKKIELMKKHIDDEPYIDPDYMWKRSATILEH